MNMLSVPSVAEYLLYKSNEAGALVEMGNRELLANFASEMENELAILANVLRELFTLVEYRDFFGESAYDRIKVRRIAEQYYEARIPSLAEDCVYLFWYHR